MKKKIILFSEPSIFTNDCIDLIEHYFDAVPMKLCQNKKEDVEAILKLTKDSGGGLFLAGGNDLFPGTLGMQCLNGENLEKFDIRRDRREMHALNYALNNNMPVIAACRGFQLAMVYLGLQDDYVLDISNSSICHSPGAAGIKLNNEYGEYPHWVTCLGNAQESYFTREWVVSAHHQAVTFNSVKFKNNVYEDHHKIKVCGIADLNYGTSKRDKEDIIELVEGVGFPFWAAQYHFEAVDAWKSNNPSSIAILEKFQKAINANK